MSNSSIPSILFVSSIFLLFATTQSASLIEVACTNTKDLKTKDFNTKQCITLLESDPKIVSAKTYKAVSLRIMESGYANATNTRFYLDNLVNKTTIPDLKAGFEKCREAYLHIVWEYVGAHEEVQDEEDYDVASYDLEAAYTGLLSQCIAAMDSAKITDVTLLRSNYVMPIYAISAITAIDQCIY